MQTSPFKEQQQHCAPGSGRTVTVFVLPPRTVWCGAVIFLFVLGLSCATPVGIVLSFFFFFSDMFVDAVTVMSSESMKCLSGVCVCSLVCLSLALFSSHLQKKKKENAPDVKLLKAESSGRRLRNSRYCNYSFYFSWKVVIPSMSYHHLCSSMSGVLPTWPPAPMAKDFEYVKATC